MCALIPFWHDAVDTWTQHRDVIIEHLLLKSEVSSFLFFQAFHWILEPGSRDLLPFSNKSISEAGRWCREIRSDSQLLSQLVPKAPDRGANKKAFTGEPGFVDLKQGSKIQSGDVESVFTLTGTKEEFSFMLNSLPTFKEWVVFGVWLCFHFSTGVPPHFVTCDAPDFNSFKRGLISVDTLMNDRLFVMNI